MNSLPQTECANYCYSYFSHQGQVQKIGIRSSTSAAFSSIFYCHKYTVRLLAWFTQLLSPTYSLGTLHLVCVWKLSKFFKELWTHCCSADPDSILDKPLKLTYHRQRIAYEFANILHALQVLLASTRVVYLMYVASNHMTIYGIVFKLIDLKWL
jgi:hypothetical protein